MPPPEARQSGPLTQLRPSALEAFELKPMKPPTPPPEATALVSTGQQASSSAPAPKKDLRMLIWELAHRVHEHFTSDWPPTWARPPFANDPNNPKASEWADYPEQLSKASGCKLKLEAWRDAPETPPKTREALTALVEKLMVFVKKKRANAAAEAEQRRKETEERERQRAATSFWDTQQRDLRALQEEILPRIAQLNKDAEALLASHKKTDPMKLKPADRSTHLGYMTQITALQLELRTKQSEIWQRVPPPGMNEPQPGGNSGIVGADEQLVKRQRL